MPEIPPWANVAAIVAGAAGSYWAARAQMRNAQTTLFKAVQDAAEGIIHAHADEIKALRERIEKLERRLQRHDLRIRALRSLIDILIEKIRVHDEAEAEAAERRLREIDEHDQDAHA